MMNPKRVRWIAIAAAVVALALGVLVAGYRAEQAEQTRNASALLALELPDPDGAPVRLERWKGKVLVVNFWATWCAPCREEMPSFVDAQAKYGARGLQFVGIAVDDAAKVRQFASEINLNYPALIGGYGALELSRALGNSLMALPFTIVLARDGSVAKTQLGPLPPEQLAGIVGQLL